MTLISSTRFFNGALLAGAMALISTEVAVAQPAPGTADSSGRLVQTWDKTFPRSEKGGGEAEPDNMEAGCVGLQYTIQLQLAVLFMVAMALAI